MAPVPWIVITYYETLTTLRPVDVPGMVSTHHTPATDPVVRTGVGKSTVGRNPDTLSLCRPG